MSQFIEETSRLTGFTTAGGNLGGTDRFMCPELYDDEPKNSATDMWALGCLVAQILTDEIPYKHITKRHGLPRAIIQGELPMTNDNGLIDSTMWECLARCWSFTPSDRPSAGELASRLIHPSSSAKITAFSRLFSIRSPFFSEPSIELSPDGRYLASACDGGVVRVWVVRNNQLIHFKSWKWPIRGAIHRVTWGRQYYLCIETSLSKVAGHVEVR
ncbi:hypothetical protein FRC02_008678 [Tulasnella sp. 418]|nr:hypothetical protein FRC02_008678 [Tulasnella sp. 418]